ncbi:MAG: pyridoxamine 5'-phosphate oxidase family protein [Actinomycetota bacterium]|nr:pyridoxamine 5'-phosphate oxidase family protein [Actinomycetota bacterium]
MLLISELARFLDEHNLGVLATTAKDGRPRQSLVYFARCDERLLIATEVGRWKARDVVRTGWASLAVRGEEAPYPSVAVAGPASLVEENVGLLTALVAQRVLGLDEPPEPQAEKALADAGRVILAIDVERVGPMSYIEHG